MYIINIGVVPHPAVLTISSLISTTLLLYPMSSYLYVLCPLPKFMPFSTYPTISEYHHDSQRAPGGGLRVRTWPGTIPVPRVNALCLITTTVANWRGGSGGAEVLR